MSYLKGHSTIYAALQVDGRRNADSQASLILRFLPKDDGMLSSPWCRFYSRHMKAVNADPFGHIKQYI